jgi:hypothetical protein
LLLHVTNILGINGDGPQLIAISKFSIAKRKNELNLVGDGTWTPIERVGRSLPVFKLSCSSKLPSGLSFYFFLLY